MISAINKVLHPTVFHTDVIIFHAWNTPFNSLAPGKFEWNLRHVIFKQILVIDGWGISCEFALIWMSLDFIDDQSTLIQVMAWCRQATSHYMSQCWPRSLSPSGIMRPQWVKYFMAGVKSMDTRDLNGTLKWKCCQYDEIFITSCSVNFDNLWNQRWEFPQNENIPVLV